MKKYLSLILIFVPVLLFSQNDTIKRDIHFGIAYPLSTNGVEAPKIINKLSLQAIMGISAGIEGLEVAGVASVDNGKMEGFQLSGCLNTASGSSQGIQASGCVNFVNGDFEGVQCSGTMNMARNVTGVQVNGGFNMAIGKMDGVQGAGFMNVADSLHGFQGAGFMNMAQKSYATQVSGFINVADDIKGFQVAGFINIARKMDGAQVAGFMNVADSCDYPIGIINFIQKGKKTLNVQTNQFNDVNLTFKSGGRKTYGIIGLGYNPFYPEFLVNMHAGIGIHHNITERFTINTEFLGSTRIPEDISNKWDVGSCATINLLLDYRLTDNFGLTAGPSINYLFTESLDGYNHTPYSLWSWADSQGYQKIFAGFTAGLYYQF